MKTMTKSIISSVVILLSILIGVWVQKMDVLDLTSIQPFYWFLGMISGYIVGALAPKQGEKQND